MANTFRTARDAVDSDLSDNDDTSEMVHHSEDSSSGPPAKKSYNIWSDVMLENSLEQKGTRVALDKADKVQQVKRGAESYEASGQSSAQDCEKFTPPIVTVTPASDDLFGDYVDISTVEKFGTSSTDVSESHKRQGNHNRHSQNSAARGSRGGWMRGRGNSRGGGPRGVKRTWPSAPCAPSPANIVKKEYSLEALMATEFAADLPVEQLGEEMACALGEKDPAVIMRIVDIIGAEKALAIFDQTRELEAGDGMKVSNGTRRRTPGGVFICLFKADKDISPDAKKSIYEDAKEKARKIKKAKRNKPFEVALQETAEILERERAKTAGMKVLPNVADALDISHDIEEGEVVDDEGEIELDMSEMEK